MNEIKSRHEIVFLYDVKDANPNGDPDDGNRPRMDSMGYNIVTDVRLKRTIRDFWLTKYKGVPGKDVLVKRSEVVEDGSIKSMGVLISDSLDLPEITNDNKGKIKTQLRSQIPEKFIDVRFFGAAITLEKANISIIGPTQFGIGRSLNKPKISSITITTTFASTEGKSAGTFGETNIVNYSLIGFEGVLSEHQATNLNLTNDDLHDLWDGLWNGTKNLNTRSKFNHSPRLLLVVVSKESEFQIGGLKRLLSLSEEEGLISEKDVIIDVTVFLSRLNEYKDKIDHIKLIEDSLVKFSFESKENRLKSILEQEGFTVKDIEV